MASVSHSAQDILIRSVALHLSSYNKLSEYCHFEAEEFIDSLSYLSDETAFCNQINCDPKAFERVRRQFEHLLTLSAKLSEESAIALTAFQRITKHPVL